MSLILLTAALLVALELGLVELSDSLDLFERDRTLAQWTAGIDSKPLLDAGRVEVVPDIAG